MNKACLSLLIVSKIKYWPEWTRKGIVKKRYVVRCSMEKDKCYSNDESTSIKSIPEPILSNWSSYSETRTIFFNCKMNKNTHGGVSFWDKLAVRSLQLNKIALLRSHFSRFCRLESFAPGFSKTNLKILFI